MGTDERHGVGVPRCGQERPGCALLDDPAVAQHRDAVTGPGHDRRVVADQDDRQSTPVAEIGQQSQDLRLGRHVQCRGRLVGDEDPGVAGQRCRDHRALPHADRELVRVSAEPLGRIGEADLFEQLDRGCPCCVRAQPVVVADALGDLVADAHHRIQVARRVLEDHADGAAAHGAQVRLGRPSSVRARRASPGRPRCAASGKAAGGPTLERAASCPRRSRPPGRGSRRAPGRGTRRRSACGRPRGAAGRR